jgi:tetratricopeptide (TPR) repeat protein
MWKRSAGPAMLDWLKKTLPGKQLKNDHKARGDACLKAGDWRRAGEFYRQAIEAEPSRVEAYVNLGFVLIEQGDHDAAQRILESALERDAQAVDAHFMLGSIARAKGRLSAAAASFERTIGIEPAFAAGYVELCSLLLQEGRPDRCRELIGQAMLNGVENADLLYWLAAMDVQDGRLDDAAENFARVIALDPDRAEAQYKLGTVLQELGQLERAAAHFGLACVLQPDNFDAWFSRGNISVHLKRYEDALASYDQCIRLDGRNAAAFCNRGAVLQVLDRLDAALKDLDEAIRLQPAFPDALVNRGKVLGRLGRYEEGLKSFAAARSAGAANLDEISYHEGLNQLVLGRFEQGWKNYEYRWKATQARYQRSYPQPLWTGRESLDGKRILLHPEQGFGDTIQFSRYAASVSGLGATVLLEVPPELGELMAGLRGVDQLLVAGDLLPQFDFHCPLLNLPLAFNTRLDTIPAPAGPLRVDPVRTASWKARLGTGSRPTAGVVWAGNPGHNNDRNRSVPLSELLRLPADRWQFVSLQKGVRADDSALLALRPDIQAFGDELASFADTAALIDALELVITVDTSVAHLAGTMGKRVWLLLPFKPDWRWLLERRDSPWYPSMRLFRQPAIGDWRSVVADVARELAA